MGLSAVSSNASFMSQLQVRQAQGEAERALSNARALRVQAQNAEQSAVQAQQNARSLRVQSDQAQQEAGQARQNVTSLQSLQAYSEDIGVLREQVSEVTAKMPDFASVPQPVINSEGQATGTVVNTTA